MATALRRGSLTQRSVGSNQPHAPHFWAPTTRPSPRRGLTLLEVIISLAIFLFAMVAVGRLITMGANHARDIQGREAQLCQSKLAELVSGVSPMQSGEGDFEEAPDWHWSVECQ